MNFLLLMAICAVILLVCIAGMAISILVKKNGQFPDTEVGTNANMKKLGLQCSKHEEVKAWRKLNKKSPLDESCATCGCTSCFAQSEQGS